MSNRSGDPDSEPTDLTELGDEIGGDSSDMSSILGDAYRGELDRETTWRSRLDQTTTWGVTLMAAILTWAFSSADNPHYIILVAVLTVTIFLLIESRRYRDYDVYRSRVRLFQKNLLSNVLDPSQGDEQDDWRAELSRDYRRPTVKVSMWEAVNNRLRRVYLPLLAVLLAAWLFRITAFVPNEDWLSTAAIAALPGTLVVTAVGAFYALVLAAAFWPHERDAMGEFHDSEPGKWKESD